jgi:hypothetical protein
MLPKYHILAGVVFSFLLYLVFPIAFNPFNVLIVFLSSVLIDVDHYFYYVYKTKDWSLNNAYKKWKGFKQGNRDKEGEVIFIFHGIETIILFLLLMFVHKIFLFVLVGILFHLLLDFICMLFIDDEPYTKSSQIYTFLKSKKGRKLKNKKPQN